MLDWKVIANYKHSSLLGLVVSDEGKKFYNIDTRLLIQMQMEVELGQSKKREGLVELIC
jgi:hypothetical protein